MFAAILATLLIVECTRGSPMANQYIDSVLNTPLQNEIRTLQLEPATISDFTINFQDKERGKAKYSNGILTGLSRVRRYSECQGPYYSFRRKNVNCTIVFDMLNINYDGEVKYGKEPKVNIKSNSNITTYMVTIEVSDPSSPYHPFLAYFSYEQKGYLQTKHTGLEPLNKCREVLDDGFRTNVQVEIFATVITKFKRALNRAVAYSPLPN